MWFRNLTLFRFNTPFELTAEALEERLAAHPFRPCGSLEMETVGWVPPLGREGQALVHAQPGRLMVCARTQQRILPAAVVREVVNDKAAEIEEEEGRKVSRKERQSIKDEVLQDLIPRAFTRSRDVYAYIGAAQGWLVIDTASRPQAEALTVLLRESLGSLPIAPPQVASSPAAVMTGWLQQGDVPPGWDVLDECELREPGEQGGVVRCARQDLGAEEVQAHLAAGKQVVRLAVDWRERLTLVLADDLQVRRLKFLDVVLDEAADDGAEDAAARFDADFAIMTRELGELLPDLTAAFGGEPAQG
jgi:recombination associated protein RdgC